MTPRDGRPEARERGAILIVVLMVLIIMSLIVMQFSFSMTVNRMTAINMTESAQLRYLAEGGLEYAKNVLRVDRQRNDTDSLHDSWNEIRPPFEPPFKVEVKVYDECGKLNVNALVQGGNVNIPMKNTLERLFLDLDINIEAVHRLVDYMDPDSDGEFEDGAKNAPLTNLTELMEIEYITPEAFFGRGEGEDREPGLADLLTVHGSGKVNINTAPPKVVMALFGKNESELGAFEDYRERNAIKSLEELPPLGMTNLDEVGSIIGFSSNTFRVVSRAKGDRLSRTVEAVVIRSPRKIRVLERRCY